MAALHMPEAHRHSRARRKAPSDLQPKLSMPPRTLCLLCSEAPCTDSHVSATFPVHKGLLVTVEMMLNPVVKHIGACDDKDIQLGFRRCLLEISLIKQIVTINSSQGSL